MRKDWEMKLHYLQNPKLSLEVFDTLMGEFIGAGGTREVFEYLPDNNFVVKIETETACGDNFSEYNIWQSVSSTENKKWFAPCQWISPNGMILIQRKTKELYGTTNNKVPDKIPSFFTDVHPKNFGWIGKQMVAHDYAFTLGMCIIDSTKRNKMQTTKNKL